MDYLRSPEEDIDVEALRFAAEIALRNNNPEILRALFGENPSQFTELLLEHPLLDPNYQGVNIPETTALIIKGQGGLLGAV